MNNNITRLDEKSTKQVFYANETNFFKIQFNNKTSSSSNQVSFNYGGRMNFMINFNEFHKYSQIKSMKVRVKSTAEGNGTTFNLNKEYSLDTDIRGTYETHCADDNGYCEVEVLNRCYESQIGTEYFSLWFLVSATIYNTTTSIDDYKPQLIVEYIDDKESIVNQKNIEGNAGRALDYSVNVRTGRPIFTKTLLSINTTVMPINLNLYYDPLQANINSSYMPKGWRFNYNQRLIANDEGYEYIDGMGLRHQFVKSLNSSSVYYDIAGTGLILTTGVTYTIEDGYKNKLIFNSAKQLLQIVKEIGGNQFGLQFEYISMTDNISSIKEYTKLSGSSATTVTKVIIAYDSGATGLTITSTGYPTITASINSSYNLVSINEEDSRVSTYTYDSNGLLLTAKTDNGEMAVFTYDTKNRIKTITNCITSEDNTLAKSTFVYEYLATFITDYFGVKTGYSFNGEGELIGQFEVSGTEYRNMQYLEKNDEYFMIDAGSAESSYGFQDVSLEGNVSQAKTTTLGVDSSFCKGDLSLDTSKKYTVSFIYNFQGALAVGDSICSYVAVVQDGEELARIELSQLQFTETIGNFTFYCNSTSALSIKVGHEYNQGTMNVKNIRITQREEVKTNICVDNYVGNRAYFTIGSDSFWIYSNLGFYYSSCDILVEKKMTLEDITENLKNIALNSTSHHIWYNKKRGLVANADNVKLKTFVSNGSLTAYKMCLVTEKDDKTSFTYSDYSSTEYFRVDYNRIKDSSSSLTLEKKMINSDFQVVKVEDSNGIVKEYEYDIYGNVISEKISHASYANYIKKVYTYNKKRLLTETSYINGVESKTTYVTNENTGRIEKVTMPDGRVIDYTYVNNTANKLSKLVTTVDAVENSNELTYSKDRISNYKGTNYGLTLSYDKYNLQCQLNNSSNTIWKITREIQTSGITEKISYDTSGSFFVKKIYDVYGNLIQQQESTNGTVYTIVKKCFYSDMPTDNVTTETTNDASLKCSGKSKLKKTIDNKINNTVKYYYNNVGLLSKETHSNTTYKSSSITYQYDDINRITQKSYDNGVRVETVNYSNSFTEEVNGYNLKLAYSYNMKLYEANSNVAYTKDYLGRITREDITTNGAYKLSKVYTYLDTNNKATNFIKTIQLYCGTSLVDTLNYQYDIMGRITKVNNTSELIKNTYQYDKLGRLIRENNKELNKTTLITYDKNGNILSKKIGAYTEGTLSSYSTYSSSYSTSYSDVLTKYNGQTVSSSNTGNITKIGSVQYLWTRERLLSSVYESSYTYTNMDYDADGIRHTKVSCQNGTIVTHKYVTEGTRILKEVITGGSCAGTINYLYLGGQIIGFTYKDAKYFFQKNLQGDIISIYNQANVKVASYEYDAWGNHEITLNTNSIGTINPFRYRGYYYDSETNLYYCNARYYNPEVSRWMSMDSLDYIEPNRINGCNLYAYCNNDPVNYVDSEGNIAISIGATVCVAALCVLAFGAADAASKALSKIKINSNDFNIVESIVSAIEDAFEKKMDEIWVHANLLAATIAALTLVRWKRRYNKTQDHHIVLQTSIRTAKSRKILSKYGLMDHELNIATIDNKYHRVMHTKLYCYLVDTSIVWADELAGEQGVKTMLAILKVTLETYLN